MTFFSWPYHLGIKFRESPFTGCDFKRFYISRRTSHHPEKYSKNSSWIPLLGLPFCNSSNSTFMTLVALLFISLFQISDLFYEDGLCFLVSHFLHLWDNFQEKEETPGLVMLEVCSSSWCHDHYTCIDRQWVTVRDGPAWRQGTGSQRVWVSGFIKMVVQVRLRWPQILPAGAQL